MDNSVINVPELAQMLRIARPTAYDLVNSEGFYPAFRIGRKILINMELLKQWMKEQSNQR